VKKKEVSGEAKQTMYIAPKSINESRAHYAPQPTQGKLVCGLP